LSNRSLKRDKNRISTLESDSPVDLYWLHRPKVEGMQETPTNLDEDKTIISEVFWDDFIIVAKAVKHLDREATIYDAFNFLREHMLGGWTILEDSDFIRKLDGEVEREYQKEVKAGKWDDTRTSAA
jgi:hypothetical protein